jgi:hypothetical protein
VGMQRATDLVWGSWSGIVSRSDLWIGYAVPGGLAPPHTLPQHLNKQTLEQRAWQGLFHANNAIRLRWSRPLH